MWKCQKSICNLGGRVSKKKKKCKEIGATKYGQGAEGSKSNRKAVGESGRKEK